MKAAVTGATGFIGTSLVRALRAEGWEVVCVGRVRNTAQIIADFLAAPPDVVFHLASMFLSQHEASDIEELVSANLLFGTQLLEAMAKTGVKRFVTAGSSWQHPRPVNLYAATKQAFEDIIAHYIAADGLRSVTLTLPDTYGPSDRRPKLINALRRALATGERLQMLPGNHLVDLIHVEDVCHSFLAAADLAAGRWSVSAGAVRLDTIVKEFERAAGKSLNIGWGERRYRPREATAPWIGEILPGWTPTISLREGMSGLFA